MMAMLSRWHVRLALLAGIVILLWAGSGLLHPLMSFMNVRAATFMPPAQTVNLKGVKPPRGEAEALRYMTLDGRTVLQVTKDGGRVYFDAQSGAEIENAERDHAVFLARHYAAENEAEVKSAEPVTRFDLYYAPVNRLLPVWRVTFERPDGLSVYVDTETDRVATVNTRAKAAMLAVFQTVHTWSFLNDVEAARVVLIALLVTGAAAMAMTGLGLVFALRRPKMPKGTRGTHRLLAVVVWIPVLMFSVSGVVHVIAYSGKPETAAIPLLRAEAVPDGLSYADVRLVPGDGRALWRMETADRRVLFADGMTGALIDLAEENYAVDVAGIAPALVKSTTKITGFTDEYGFGNRILPVWRVERTDSRTLVFADTRTGRVSAVVDPAAKAELWSFNMLHKWNFLNFMGPAGRDGVLMAFAVVVIVSAGCGLVLLLRRAR